MTKEEKIAVIKHQIGKSVKVKYHDDKDNNNIYIGVVAGYSTTLGLRILGLKEKQNGDGWIHNSSNHCILVKSPYYIYADFDDCILEDIQE